MLFLILCAVFSFSFHIIIISFVLSLLLFVFVLFFFFKQKTAYEMRISDWSSDVCSSDLLVSSPLNRRRQDYRLPHRPIPRQRPRNRQRLRTDRFSPMVASTRTNSDRKSTRLNSSH